jgi:hypothetical protein
MELMPSTFIDFGGDRRENFEHVAFNGKGRHFIQAGIRDPC